MCGISINTGSGPQITGILQVNHISFNPNLNSSLDFQQHMFQSQLTMTHKGHSAATESCESIQELLRHFLTVPTERKQWQEWFHIGFVTILPFCVHRHTSSDRGSHVRNASYDRQMTHNWRATNVPGDLSLRTNDGNRQIMQVQVRTQLILSTWLTTISDSTGTGTSNKTQRKKEREI